jgi:hypothetical protein
MTAISQEKIKNTYKASVIIEKATPEVLQDFLKRSHVDCPENLVELHKGKDYEKTLLSILQKADLGVLERLHNVAVIAQNSPALPLVCLWAYRERYDLTLPDTMGYDRPMDAVLWMAAHYPERFKTFVATQRYHFQGKRTRTDRVDIAAESTLAPDVLYDNARRYLLEIIKDCAKGNVTYSEESLIFESYGDELVASLLTGEPYISDELDETGEEIHRNINKPAPITIVIRPNKALLVFAPNKPLQGTLAQAIGEKVFGLTNVDKKPERSQAFDVQKIFSDIMMHGTLSLQRPPSHPSWPELLGLHVDTVNLTRRDGFRASYTVPKSKNPKDYGQFMARELLGKYTKYPQKPDVEMSYRKECWSHVDVCGVDMTVFYNNQEGTHERLVRLSVDGSSNLTTEPLDDAIIAWLERSGYYGPKASSDPLAILRGLFNKLSVKATTHFGKGTVRGLHKKDLVSMEDQGLFQFLDCAVYGCDACGDEVPLKNDGAYVCKNCGDMSQVSPYGYEATRESVAKAIQKAFSLKGEIRALPTDGRLFSLGETEDHQPVLLWFGDTEPNENVQHTTITLCGIEATILHTLAAPPKLKKGQGIYLFDRLQWKDKTGFKGKIQKPQSHKSISTKGGHAKGQKRRHLAEPKYKELRNQHIYQNSGGMQLACDDTAQWLIDSGHEKCANDEKESDAVVRISSSLYNARWRKDWEKQQKFSRKES